MGQPRGKPQPLPGIADHSDDTLLRGLFQSEEPLAVLRQLYERHGAAVRAVAGRHLNDANADALTCAVFVDLGRDPQRYATTDRLSLGIRLIVETHRRAVKETQGAGSGLPANITYLRHARRRW